MQDGTPIIIKKIRKGGHGHHGGAWKVAYADFVTAMMAFFLVMWILGMSDEDKKAIAQYFKTSRGISKISPKFDPQLGMTERPPASDMLSSDEKAAKVTKEQTEMTQIESDVKAAVSEDPKLKGLLDDGDVTVKKTADGLLIELIENETTGEVFFESGSSVIRPQAKQVFTAIAPILAKTKRLMEIKGHTDRTPYAGANGYDNYDLSSDRAFSVKRLLFAGGVSSQQLLGVEGRADQEPRVPSDPYHFSNRRVTILLPYQFQRGPADKLPTGISNPSVEGAFSAPKGMYVPDLRSKYQAQESEKSASADH